MPFARDDHADPPARKGLLWDRHGLAYGGSRYEWRQARLRGGPKIIALCVEIYTRSARVPYDIYRGDELVDASLVRELAAEIALSPPLAATYGRTSVFATYTGYFNQPRVVPTAFRHRIFSRRDL